MYNHTEVCLSYLNIFIIFIIILPGLHILPYILGLLFLLPIAKADCSTFYFNLNEEGIVDQHLVDSLITEVTKNDSISASLFPLLESGISNLTPTKQLRIYQAIGNYYQVRENPDSAIKFYSRGLLIAEKYSNNYYIAKFHLRKGINYNIESEYETALNELLSAAQIAAKTDSIGLQNTIARYTGNVYWGMGIYEKALDNYFRTLIISEENHFTRDIASTLNNIGNVYQSINDYNKARDYYSRALKLAEQENYSLVAAITSNNLGDLLLLQKKYDSALVYFNHSLELSTSLSSKFYQGIALFNIGNIHLQKDSLQEARKYLHKSLSKALEAGDRLGISECYLKLGEIFLKSQQPKTAEIYLDSGLLIARQIGSLRLLDLATELKTDYYTQTGDFSSAYKTLELRLQLKDSIFNQENGKNIAKLEARNKDKLRERQIADLRHEKINNRNLYLIGTFSLLSILMLIILGLRSSRKKNDILSAKNEEIENQRLLLIQKNSELINSQAELKKINQSKDQFLTVISHDLKNPVSAMRGFLELLINRFEVLNDSDKKRFLQEVFDSVERVSLLINNILYWIKSQTSGLTIQRVSFDLQKRIRDNLSLYAIIAGGKEIDLINNVPEDFEIYGDVNIYDTIFRNLISNSLKFTPAKGSIIFDARKQNGKVIISIKDTGVGIDQSKIDDILNQNVHYSTTGTQHEIGTGLGLSLIQEFTRYLNADLTITSTPGEGTIVNIIAPVII